jgi:hypothetical protein
MSFSLYDLPGVVGEVARDIDGFGEKFYYGSLFLLFFLAERKFHLITDFHGVLLYVLAVSTMVF